ncbi:MAG: Uncharacterized protein Athens071426_597 [Parcubacteria group bacterium Athens0714_26]|nr:MAG: Uncharacterized protein Athens101426_435 [Parcubacteria group bacterium Athens1014_26]TSD01957.1 MAG: Uncharacterized protein Athens071426_597 [Parcubacteria group bacterium Athens0714_26]
MKFHYVASSPKGAIVEGETDAQSAGDALVFLSGQGLRPISLKVVKGQGLLTKKSFGQGVSVEDKVFLTKYLALMLRAGTDLFKAIDILIQDFDKPMLKAILMEIRSTLEKGQPFYLTFIKYPKYFSNVFVNLVRAGEASGNLESVFTNLSVSLEKEQELRSKIKSALIYPAILMSLSIVILLLLVTFSLPKIANVFLTSGFNPPLFSRIVFSIGLFLNAHMILIFGALVAVVFVVWYFLTKVKVTKKIFQHLLLRVPVLGKTLKEIALQRFAATLSLLMKAGLPILDSLEITAGAVGADEIREALLRISREGIAKGLTMGEAFRKESAFPLVISNLISVSERAGHTEDILKTLSDFYEKEIDSMVKSLVSFLEPVMLLFIGVIIGLIALAIIVPMYQLVGNI